MNAQRLRELNAFRKQAQAPSVDVIPPAVDKGAFGKQWGGTNVMGRLQPGAQKLPTKAPAPPKDSPLVQK